MVAAILNAEIVTIDSSSDEELFPSTDEQKKDNPVESKNKPVEKKKEKLVKSNKHVHFDANLGANADIYQSNDARWDSSVHNHEVKKKKAIARSQNRLTKRETGTSLMDMGDTSSDDDDDENPSLAAVKNKPVINKPVINKPVKNDTAATLNAENVTIDSSSDEELFP